MSPTEYDRPHAGYCSGPSDHSGSCVPTDREDDAIRADLAVATHDCACVGGAVVDCGHGINVRLQRAATTRLLADVAPLLARAVAAEARAEQAESEKEGWKLHAGAKGREYRAELAEARARVAELEKQVLELRTWAAAVEDAGIERNRLRARVAAVEALRDEWTAKPVGSGDRYFGDILAAALAAASSDAEGTTQ